MARGPDFFREMTQAQIDALEEYARHPGKTIDECHEWLADQQVRTSRSAVGRWLQDFRLWDRNKRADEIARSYLAAAAEADPHAVAQASLKKFQELVFERLASGDELDAGELMKISVALKTGLGAQQVVNELKKQQAEAIRAAEVAAKSGASGVDVIAVMRRELGLGSAA